MQTTRLLETGDICAVKLLNMMQECGVKMIKYALSYPSIPVCIKTFKVCIMHLYALKYLYQIKKKSNVRNFVKSMFLSIYF